MIVPCEKQNSLCIKQPTRYIAAIREVVAERSFQRLSARLACLQVIDGGGRGHEVDGLIGGAGGMTQKEELSQADGFYKRGCQYQSVFGTRVFRSYDSFHIWRLEWQGGNARQYQQRRGSQTPQQRQSKGQIYRRC